MHDLFEVNTVWELETERAAAEETAAGDWQVTLDVRARKVVFGLSRLFSGEPQGSARPGAGR